MLDEEIRQSWARNLRARRDELGLTQFDLAVAAKSTLTSVWRWENPGPEGTTPSDGNKIALARALRCEVRDLFPMPATSPSEPAA